MRKNAIEREMRIAPILPKEKLAIKGIENPVFAPMFPFY
jgi:hypothetical protein